MLKFLNYVTAVFKISYDKSSDYIGYYTTLSKDGKSDENKDMEDTIYDYVDVINAEEYTDENKNKRIFKKIGIYEEYSWFFGKPSHIIDNIYLGSAFNAASYYDLKESNIKVILNVTKEISEYYPDEFTYFHYDIYDNNMESIGEYLEKAYQDIKKYQKEYDGNILIHCYMGASRSASIVIYYLMRKHNYTFDHALEFIKTKRPVVNPTFKLTKDLAESRMNL